MNTYDYVQAFGTKEGKDLLRKALTSDSSSGGSLIAEHLETIITNEMVRLVPELAVPEYKYDPQSVHEFTKIVALPAPGSAMGEASVTPVSQSQLQRAAVPLKVLKRKGSVTGFVSAAARENYEAVEVETENHLQAFANDMASYTLYGNKDADAYTFDGLDKFIASNRVNETWGGTVPSDFEALNAMLDASNRKKGAPHRRAFIMSPELLTLYSGLYTQVRDNRNAQRDGTEIIEIDGGWRLQTYRFVPILESTQTRPQEQMGAVAYSDAGAGAAIPDDTRYFQVSAVTWDGETIASAEVNGTSVGADTITLSWTANANAMFYKIYASDTTGQAKLVKIISGFTYNVSGTKTGNVTSVTFTTEPLTPDPLSVPTHMIDDRPFNYTGDTAPESLFLWDLDPYQGMGKIAYTNEDGNRLDGVATIIPLAKIDDTDDFLIKSYCALIDAFEATSAMHRGLRTA